MKSILISIHPKWCQKIFTIIGRDFFGKPKYWKRLDLRKTAPKPPFRGYIYCTKDNTDNIPSRIWWKADKQGFQHIMNGKVIGEFTCDYVLRFCEMANADIAEEQSCVSREDILKYSKGKEVKGLRISDLVIYDEPKELSEFIRICPEWKKGEITDKCLECEHLHTSPIEHFQGCDCEGELPIIRPPQSWCYVDNHSSSF